MYSTEELANDFCKLGVRAGDTVMLHATVRAVGKLPVAQIKFILRSNQC